MGPALDQAPLLELVDEGDHAARGHLDRLADRLLRAALGGVDEVEDPEQRRMQVDLGDPLGELTRGVDPHLREEEGEGRGRLVAGYRFSCPWNREAYSNLLSAKNRFS